MQFTTQKKIIKAVLGELALVEGSGVQFYTEPAIMAHIQTCFDHLFEKRFWDHLSNTTTHEIDDTDGVVTDDLSGILSITDIQWIRRNPYRDCDKIPYIKDGVFVNSITGTEGSGFTGIFYKDTAYYETKRIKFSPAMLGETIKIRARYKPDDFINENSVVPFDRTALQHFVTASILATDGTNPVGQSRQEALFNDRYETLVMNESTHEIKDPVSRFSPEFTVADT